MEKSNRADVWYSLLVMVISLIVFSSASGKGFIEIISSSRNDS